MKKIMLISEALSAPFDEGFKNVVFSLHKQFEDKGGSVSITSNKNNTGNLDIKKIPLNKMFLNKVLRQFLKEFSPDIVVYVPLSSCTFFSFLRARILKLMSKKNTLVFMLGSQHREHSSIVRFMLRKYLKPDLLLLLGSSDEDYYRKNNMMVRILPPAVDCLRFDQATEVEKAGIRDRFNIPRSIKVILHVGHININRNVGILADILKLNGVKVVVVGSTSTNVEHELKDELVKKGVLVIDEYISDISHIYKMSDIYVFPVRMKTAAIDMPLSVLEAMACNLPVVTTKFEGLFDHFVDDSGFRYFETIEQMIQLIDNMELNNLGNRAKVEPFTWEAFADEVIKMPEVLE